MTMAKIGKILNVTKFRHEGDSIYAFKPKPDPFLCFFHSGKKIIITNAFEKKQDKLSPMEKKKALSYQRIIELELRKVYIMDKEKKDFTSTYERLINEDPEFEKDLEKRYRKFILSELLLAVMEEDHISIRKLAKEAGVSPSLIQDLRTGKKDNLTFRSFSNIVEALGYDIVLEKRRKKTPAPAKLKMTYRKRMISKV